MFQEIYRQDAISSELENIIYHLVFNFFKIVMLYFLFETEVVDFYIVYVLYQTLSFSLCIPASNFPVFYILEPYYHITPG